MRRLIFILTLFTFVAAAGQTNLDGKTYSIKLKITGPERLGRNWTKDELEFKDGSFTCKIMGEGEKFPPFQYTSVDSSGAIKFAATGQNHGGSTISWDGKVTGDKIEGIAIWTNRNGPQKHHFKGSIKK